LLTKINQTGTVGHELDSGKKRKMGIAGNIDSVKKLILSQENAAKRTF